MIPKPEEFENPFIKTKEETLRKNEMLDELLKPENTTSTPPWGRKLTAEERRIRRKKVKIAKEQGITLPGMKKTDKIYRRKYLTEKDFKIMKFIALSRFITTSQAAQILEIKAPASRLNGLREFKKLVKFQFGVTSTAFWGLSTSGLKALHERNLVNVNEGSSTTEREIVASKIPHCVAISQVVLSFLKGEVLENMPPVAIENIVSERLIYRDFSAITGGGGAEAMVAKAFAERAKTLKIVEKGVLKRSELNSTFPFRWMVLDRFEGKYKLPDLVVSFENLRKNKPSSFAVEVEISLKSPKDYEEIFKIYKNGLKEEYIRVVYFTQSKTIKNALVRGAVAAGFPLEKLIILPIKDGKGEEVKEIWQL